LNDVLYDVTSPISVGDAIVVGTNITAANKISANMQTLTNKTDGLWDNMMDNGAVNLLQNNATTQNVNGITFTVNADKTITANGTATADAQVTLNTSGTSAPISGLETGNYKLSGCPIGGGNNTYQLFAKGLSNNYYSDSGDGVSISNDGIAYVRMVIKNGQTVSNLVFKPMISDLSLNLSYDDYVPYAMTNRELTDNNTTLNKLSEITNITSKLTGFNMSLLKYGNVVTFSIYIGDVTDITAWTEALMTLPSDCKPPIDIYIHDNNSTEKVILIRASTGDVNVDASSTTIHASYFITTYVVN
jgi:hypothetical protein